ncbi:MAG: aspartate--tRNA(Asn) ligase [Candidatus Micrarchaeota archaeon]|nr:aspartate--tRNA(Asn) ligase [Candidatus Micrarchaeota archaeon]
MYRSHYISEAMKTRDKEVAVAGWVHEVRDLGKLKFVLLRDRTGIIQVTAKKGVADEKVLAAMDVPKETVVSVTGKVVASKIAEAGCELIPTKFEVLNEISKKVPFEVTGKVPADLDVRLDFRYVDLRTKNTAAIFKIRSEIAFAFREAVRSMGFVEIHPPSIVEAATEGGAEVFKVQYFEKEAYLVQSPQLYKQLAVIGGMDRVFMTVPVFRAEKHNTLTHLNEATQMDIEAGFITDKEAVDYLEKVFLHILSHVKKECEEELKTLKRELAVPSKIPRHTYTELVERLNEDKEAFKWGEDFSRETEALLADELGYSTYFVTEWPTAIRAFYSMPDENNPKICRAYDLNFESLEVASGAQRIHKPEILIKQLKARNLNPSDFEFYINAFRVGAPPHAGWSIGLDRLNMKICGLHNIREAVLFPRDRVRVRP